MNAISNLEERVMEKVNATKIERKSSEIHDGNHAMPLTLTQEVRESAIRSIQYNNLEVPQEILDRFRNRQNIDLKKFDEVIGWNLFWAQEMEAAKIANAMGGGKYQDYLPGRYLHYDLIGYHISHLFNGGTDSIKDKKVLELGSGSGLGLMSLAQDGAIVAGMDSSAMANDFSTYLSGHYGVSAEIREGNYFCTTFDEGKFDVVYTSGVFEHISDPSKLLNEMERLTKPGGYIVITIPNEESRFYKNFKENEKSNEKKYMGLVGIPVEHQRHKNLDPEDLMVKGGLDFVKKDGILVAPSTDIKRKDILEDDLLYFDSLPRNPSSDVENKVASWRGFELRADPNLRIRYGWSSIYIAQKPILSEPMSNNG